MYSQQEDDSSTTSSSSSSSNEGGSREDHLKQAGKRASASAAPSAAPRKRKGTSKNKKTAPSSSSTKKKTKPKPKPASSSSSTSDDEDGKPEAKSARAPEAKTDSDYLQQSSSSFEPNLRETSDQLMLLGSFGQHAANPSSFRSEATNISSPIQTRMNRAASATAATAAAAADPLSFRRAASNSMEELVVGQQSGGLLLPHQLARSGASLFSQQTDANLRLLASSLGNSYSSSALGDPIFGVPGLASAMMLQQQQQQQLQQQTDAENASMAIQRFLRSGSQGLSSTSSSLYAARNTNNRIGLEHNQQETAAQQIRRLLGVQNSTTTTSPSLEALSTTSSSSRSMDFARLNAPSNVALSYQAIMQSSLIEQHLNSLRQQQGMIMGSQTAAPNNLSSSASSLQPTSSNLMASLSPSNQQPTQQQQQSQQPIMTLGLDEDHNWLSEFQCFIRSGKYNYLRCMHGAFPLSLACLLTCLLSCLSKCLTLID